MNYDPYVAIRRVRGLPGRLNQLGEHLRILAGRVRESVAEAVGETVSCTIRDSLGRLWSGQRILETPLRQAPAPREHDWYDDRERDPWGQEPGPWDGPVDYSRHSTRAPEPVLPKSSALVLAMQMAGWWMYRRGTLAGALGLGLVVGSVALIGGRIAKSGLGLIESASTIFALNNALGAGALALNDA